MSKHMLPAKARGIVAVRADAGGDVTKILADLQKDWHEFKATQAQKDKEVNAKFDDVVTTEKMQRIDSSVSELQAAVDQANAKLAAMTANGGGAGGVKDQEYTDAFRAHFRKGEVQANLNKGAADEGGYLAPVEWDRTITDKLIEVSAMRQIAGVQTISGNGFTKLFNLRGTASGWVGEAAARPETGTATFGSMTFTTGEIYANPAATQQMLDDAEVNLEAWIAGEVETEFSYQEGLAFISGNGTNKPNGFLTYVTGGANAAANPLGAIEAKAAASGSAITEDELLDLIYAVPSAYTGNSRFVMNRTTMGVVRKLRDSTGRQLWEPSSQVGQPSQLLAYPVTEMPGMPDIALSSLPIAFGDFRRGYLIVDRTGVRVLRDPFTNKPYVHFYTTKRVGGGVVNPECLKVLQMAAA
ncbi:phage major capsid protein [Thioclava sp. NG1]|uniref:phage major capsid protein n=1 Tax=Thioclava sp. NG1 TaxID=2182426 RepID=UPI000D620D17|nr:phage major capsid protein [Thioclava sp. NG1]PWE48476.1 phage major capsid protein [Thioclava sp. NG1]